MLRLTALAGFILALAAPVYAQAQANVQLDQMPQLNPIAGAPTVAITKLDLFKTTALTSVGVEWAAQKPTLTKITRFDVTFDVTYQNGKKQSVSKSITDSGARATSFTGFFALPVRSTATRITTSFTTPGALTASEDCTINVATQPPPRPLALDLIAVNLTSQGCGGANQDCFEVKWGASNATFPSRQSFQSFNLKLTVNYNNGATVNGSANASGAERKKIIALSRPHGGVPQTAQVTINANVILRGQTSVVKETAR